MPSRPGTSTRHSGPGAGGRGSVARMEATVLVLGLVVALGGRSPLHVVAVRAVDALAAHAGRRGVARATATAPPPCWFIAGAVVGGATLGAVMAALADGRVVARRHLHRAARDRRRSSRCSAPRSTAACSGVAPPFFKRQVNEYWLGRYRAWVYGSGFGWQIGAGVTTYIMTAAVFVTVAFGALTAGPWAALAHRRVLRPRRVGSRCCSPRAAAPPPSCSRSHRRLRRAG